MALKGQYMAVQDEKVLTIDDFRQVNRAVFRARAKWREIGTELLLEPHILNNISGSNQDCLTEMLQEWLRQRGLKPSWRKLVEALKDITVREEGIAADIEQEYLIGGDSKLGELATQHPSTAHEPEFGEVVEADRINLLYLKKALKTMPIAAQQIAIGICNESGSDFLQGKVFLYNGASSSVFPPMLPNRKGVVYDVYDTGHVYSYGIKGVNGVIAYQIDDGKTKLTLGIMFTVPFLISYWGIWWSARIYPEQQEASKSMYDDLRYKRKKWAGDSNWHGEGIGCGYRVNGAMVYSSSSVLLVKVTHERL